MVLNNSRKECKLNMKKTKLILLYIVIFLIGITIGITTTKYMTKEKTKENYKEQSQIKESPYTLEELYEIVEDPVLFYEANCSDMTEYNKVMFNFYDYFSKSTPVKIATKTNRNYKGTVIEVLETDYINYSEYMELMKEAYNYASETKKLYEKDNLEPSYNYELYITRLIYGN